MAGRAGELGFYLSRYVLARREHAGAVTPPSFLLLCILRVLLSKGGTFADLQNKTPFLYRDLRLSQQFENLFLLVKGAELACHYVNDKAF